MKAPRNLLAPLAAMGIAVLGAGCGGAALLAGGGIGGTGISLGPIIAFGSIVVNDVKYDTDGAEIFVNDAPATQDDLALGMLVTVTGEVNSDGITGTASRVEYSTAIEGPVSEASISADGSGLLVALGQVVETRPGTVFDPGDSGIPGLDAVPVNALVEVSGYTDGSGLVVATRLEVKAADWSGEDIEVAGAIQDLSADTFRIGELTVLWNEVTLLPAEPLANGLLVKVFSTRGFDSSGRLVAERIELENDGVIGIGEEGEGEEVDIRGIVTEGLVDNLFLLSGQPVRVTSETEFDDGTASDLVPGVEVKVEGVVQNGEIVAEEIEFEDDSDGDADSDSDSDDGDSSTDGDSDSDSDSDDGDSSTDSDSDSASDSDTTSDSSTDGDSDVDTDTDTDSDTTA